MRCTAYSLATSFNSNKLYEYLKSRYGASRFREVISMQIGKTDTPTPEGYVFCFPYGAIVCWGLEQTQERSLINEIKDCEMQPIEIPAEDLFTYTYGDEASILDDELVLPNTDLATKLSFSHGLAQSVKLDSFEQIIQKTIHLTRELPELLAKDGEINLSRKDIRRMMGRLFIDRSSINLHQELLDTPEFFWNHSELEPYYNLVAHYLDRERRVNILNQRLKIIQELFDMLNVELNHQHSSYLEWIIIALIVVEVVISLIADVFHLT